MRNLPPAIALDTETFLISKAEPYPRMVCLSYASSKESGVIHAEDTEEILHNVFQACSAKQVTVVFHNCAFDLRVMCNKWPSLVPLVHKAFLNGYIVDTSHMQRLFEYATEGASEKWSTLAKLAKDLLDITMDKSADTWRLRYSELVDIPVEDWPKNARIYARKDAKVTLAVYQEMIERYPSHFITPAIRSSYDAFTASFLTNVGFPVDEDELDKVEAHNKQRQAELLPLLLSSGMASYKTVKGVKKLSIKKKVIDQVTRKLLRKDMRRIGIKLPNPFPKGRPEILAAMKQHEDVKTLFEGGLLPWELTPKNGAVQITEKLMEYVMIKYADDPTVVVDGTNVLRLYDEYKTVGSFLGAQEGKGRISDLRAGGSHLVHTSYDVLKATWRKGSSNPNLQNVPKKGGLRECFTPGEDHLFAIADFSGLELYGIAQVCLFEFGRSKLAEMLAAGVDVHMMVGEMFAGDRLTEDNRKTWRNLAKAFNFGYWGGLGRARFNILLTEQYFLPALSEEEWLEYSGKYKAFFPEILQYRNAYKSVGLVRHFGSEHYRLLKDGWDPEEHRKISAYCKRMNTRFQCLGAVAAKLALTHVVRAYELGKSKAKPVADIHDEIVAIVPARNAGRIAVQMGLRMEKAAKIIMPDVNPKVEVVLSTHWAKDAKPIFTDDSHTELVCWTPAMRIKK